MTLSTPVLWVLFPLAMAALIGVFYQRQVLGIILTCLTAFGLSILAIFFPEDLLITIGSFEIVFTESIGFFGRKITVAVSMLPFISLIYAAAGLWAIISSLPNTPASFRPLSLAITALLTAVMGVEPFLYAALLIQTAVLASIPMLSPICCCKPISYWVVRCAFRSALPIIVWLPPLLMIKSGRAYRYWNVGIWKK